MIRRSLAAVAAAAAALCLAPAAHADETSSGDKLRILYSNRFTFTDDGLPLVTVEIVGGRDTVTLAAKGGLVVRPDGGGGSAVETRDGATWTIRAEDTQPAEIEEWVVVARLAPDDATGAQAERKRWKERGYAPRTFEVGAVFGVDGEVIDTREMLIAVDGGAAPGGAARAAKIARKYGVAATVHRDLVRRPTGTIIAESGGTVVRNPSVLWFQPRDATETVAVDDVPVGAGGSQAVTRSETRRYWGSVYVTLDADGHLVAVNAVPEDKLLDGLVPAEIFPDAPAEALQAQAIAARTELLEKIGHRNTTDPFLLCSTQQCQVYAGAGHEDPRTTRAVEQTRGIVILRDGGGLADIRYSASCGGHGEDNDRIWGGDADPSLRGHTDATGKTRFASVDADNLDAFLDDDADHYWCGRTKKAKGRFRWSVTVSAKDLDALVAKQYPEVGRVRALTPTERGTSGRIGKLEIRGSKGTVVAEGDLHIRRLLGGLKSTLFAIRVDGPADAPKSFTFDGAGFGHGVGMCQVGAIGMAEAGKSHDDILDHYYRGTHLHRLY
ncbi:MAG: SpoIID/LytB domain-containing protein [Kofleriaceae bacterium]|nr:SpoIID/LytB domain-containing protein [Myxococcales bacterium]MCB9559755.1 SpoIID/LytB domain-containing protein [Kofleriaceae bacterium]MCB9572941.1 SpoIID/LytB domain-containing protein [Kofleriaceae bacterium]